MVCLAENVQVRKENWGLLFYSQPRHKVCFVRSGSWLEPAHFDGGWSLEHLAADITGRTGKSAGTVIKSLRKLIGYLVESGMVADELR
jgi:hypothetical protein